MKMNGLKKLISPVRMVVVGTALVSVAGMTSATTLTACNLTIGGWGGANTGGEGGGTSGGNVVVTCDCSCTQDSMGMPYNTPNEPPQQYCGPSSQVPTMDQQCGEYCKNSSANGCPQSGFQCCTLNSATPSTAITCGDIPEIATLGTWGVPQSTDASLNSATSTATLTYFGQQITIPVSGSVEFTGGCSGNCNVSFTAISLSPAGVTAPGQLSLPAEDGQPAMTLTNVTVMNIGTVAATQIDEQLSIPAQGALFNVSAVVNGVLQAATFTPQQSITGSYNPSTGQFTLAGDLLSGSSFGLSFSLVNATIARPPIANAGAAQTVTVPPTASSGTADLNGSLSSDPDGNLSHIDWYEGSTYLGTGTQLYHVFSLGVHTVTAYVWDTTDKWSSATTTVTVAHRPLSQRGVDFDGDGEDDPGVFRPSTGTWYLRTTSAPWSSVSYGQNGDIPVPGDYDGDGKTDIAVFRPSTGTWYLRTTSAPWSSVVYGQNGDIPVPADYDGIGHTEIAVFRPSSATWLLDTQSPQQIQYGATGDIPAPVDYDGDGKADIAVFRPSAGIWFLRTSSSPWSSVSWGGSGDIPVPADYQGTGKADVAQFIPSTGVWSIEETSQQFSYGVTGDIPLEHAAGCGFSPAQMSICPL
jgi:FG-GAP repeat